MSHRAALCLHVVGRPLRQKVAVAWYTRGVWARRVQARSVLRSELHCKLCVVCVCVCSPCGHGCVCVCVACCALRVCVLCVVCLFGACSCMRLCLCSVSEYVRACMYHIVCGHRGRSEGSGEGGRPCPSSAPHHTFVSPLLPSPGRAHVVRGVPSPGFGRRSAGSRAGKPRTHPRL